MLGTSRSGWCGGDAEWTATPVDERGSHAGRLRANAVEGMVGNEKNLIPPHAHDLSGHRV